MKHIDLVRLGLCSAVFATASLAEAAQHHVCVNDARGVPSRPGAPAWAAWPSGPATVDTALDDPRWNEATAKAFATGSATAPLHVRQLWTLDGAGQEWLYISIISDLDPNATTARDVFVGLRRVNPETVGGLGTVNSHIFQFHLAPGGPQTAALMPFCGRMDRAECQDGAVGSLGNWWRVYRDVDAGTSACDLPGGGTVTGRSFIAWNGATFTTAPFTWLSDSVAAWKIGTNRWAIQMRLKIIAASASPPPPFENGVEKGSTLWYEATHSLGTPYASIGRFPEPSVSPPLTGVTHSVCVQPATNDDRLIHEDLGVADSFSKLTDVAGPPPADCDGGLAIFPARIGAVFNNPGPYDALQPTNQIGGSNPPRPNTMIAQVVNTTTADITQPVAARFRLANWGTTVFTPGSTDTGTWDDIRGGASVCLGGGSPCTPQVIPGSGRKAIHFNWTLGDDSVMGNSEYCRYGLNPPGGACTTVGCAAGETKSTVGTATVPVSPCVERKNSHQCLFVELTSPNGSATFTQQSAFNNMNFGAMSVLSREAVIDTRQLPVAKDQKYHDVFLIVMPRNMPVSVPGGPKTTDLVKESALATALRISAPYDADFQRLSRENADELKKIIEEQQRERDKLPGGGRIEGLPRDDKRLEVIARGAALMPNADFERVRNRLLVGFGQGPGQGQSDRPSEAQTRAAVDLLGPGEAAELVPTLEIYPFFRAPGEKALQQMAAFAIFLSHEGTLNGITYEIDGVRKIAENMFHVRIPVGFARQIQVRSQALTPPEGLMARGNPQWPCSGGGCCPQRSCGLVQGLGNAGLGMIAAMFVVFRRRRRR